MAMRSPSVYTDLMHAKRLMAGESTPAWTPVTREAARVVDPAFVPGMGALSEDVEEGLRCPVKGCGIYTHYLSKHLDKCHPEVGAKGLRKTLGIPKTAPLLSHSARLKISEHMKSVVRADPKAFEERRKKAAKVSHSAKANRRRVASRSASMDSVGYRNLRDRCEQQTRHRIIDLQNEIGRVPSQREFEIRYGKALFRYVVRVYGSWSNVLSQMGMQTATRGRAVAPSTDDVLDSLSAWVAQHGDLPSAEDADKADRAPLMFSRALILAAFKTGSWALAMQTADALLDLGGRYSTRKKKGAA